MIRNIFIAFQFYEVHWEFLIIEDTVYLRAILCVPKENVYSAIAGWSILQGQVRSNWIMMLFACTFLLVFCQWAQSVTKECWNSSVDLCFTCFSLLRFCFVYFEAVLWGILLVTWHFYYSFISLFISGNYLYSEVYFVWYSHLSFLSIHVYIVFLFPCFSFCILFFVGGVLKIALLLRSNSHTVQFIYLKYTVQWVLRICVHSAPQQL